MTKGQRFQYWRHTCGWTQAQAAKQLGYSIDTISDVECFRLDISPRLARAATAVSGVAYQSLENPLVEFVTTDGRPFTSETFSQWRLQHCVAGDELKEIEHS